MNAITVKTLKVNVRSTLIEFLEYDCYHQLLKVRFKKGKSRQKIHEYDGVSSGQFLDILDSPSVGKAILKLNH